ncbi:Holliday junction DNA helicase RuvA [Diaminobutyricimonas aerilata]|uniref:Holliday junction branch migration complex subunit RuvA n=1 Tax=Diaminobutyricimonas aerilata TaxID=1162967 RepID=A0A2M9CK94_9MICO|nr:Holliday junction branch migration protein RuvA [Diaminobutyricimonas aerilata]PJJ72321.1 Holliday junction DNA helicase RuvA [Diaminobutyricimonas aerilata]
MISSLRGTVLHSAGTTVVIEVGGVGLSVQVTPQHALALRVGAEALVHTALIVREDELSLYGFQNTEELAIFDLLRGVTGVGPKSALGVLATLAPDEVADAVATENDAAFRKVSGIGPKTAKLIVVSLAGKLAAVAPRAVASVPDTAIAEQVTAALTGLGWPERIAAQAASDAVASAAPGDRVNVPVLLRSALALLGPNQPSALR